MWNHSTKRETDISRGAHAAAERNVKGKAAARKRMLSRTLDKEQETDRLKIKNYRWHNRELSDKKRQEKWRRLFNTVNGWAPSKTVRWRRGSAEEVSHLGPGSSVNVSEMWLVWTITPKLLLGAASVLKSGRVFFCNPESFRTMVKFMGQKTGETGDWKWWMKVKTTPNTHFCVLLLLWGLSRA